MCAEKRYAGGVRSGIDRSLSPIRFASSLANFSLRFSSRVMLFIHVLQTIECDMGVDLGRGDISVAENRLQGSQIGSVLDHVSGATVAQHVRTGVAAHRCRIRPQHLPDPLAREFSRAATEKYQGGASAPRQRVTRTINIASKRIERRLSQGHNAFLVSFSAHQNIAEFELQVLQFDADDFRDAECSRVKHLQHGPVASCNGLVLAAIRCCPRRLEESLDFLPGQRLWEYLPLPG